MTTTTPWNSSAERAKMDVSAVILRIIENGILTGILGALTVAVWFLVLDVISRGMPLYTPSLLGGVLFGHMEPGQVTDQNGAAIFAYTGLHGVLFLLAGVGLSWMFSQCERNPQLGLILLLLFVLFEAIVWSVGVTIIPALAGVYGAWAIIVANLGSAGAMFGFLVRRHPHAMEGLREAWNEK